jgi:diguanylate cyclase (GGDEF)-like protein
VQGVVWVASFRVGVGLLALLVLPMRYATLAPYRPLFGAYVVWSAMLVVLVWRRLGGELRPLVGGLVDQLLLSFLIHEVGSTTTMLSAMYMLSGTMNALVVSFRVGVTLAVFGSVLFAGMIAAEQLGWLRYAPAAPDWLRLHPPTPSQAFAAAVLAAGILILSTLIVGRLVRKLRARESELLAKNAQLEELSQRDTLTQLYNRRHLFARIEAELARVNRGQVLSVLMIDLDGFKRVNDQFGHLRGDLLLKEVAAALAATVRTTDVPGRVRGVEFGVLHPDTGREAACAAAERVALALAEVGRRFDAATPITASVGVAIAQPGDTVAAVLHRADHSSYGAKRGGGNQVVLAEVG